MSRYPPAANGAGSKWCPALYGVKSGNLGSAWLWKEPEAHFCSLSTQFLAELRSYILQPVLGLGEFQGELPINQIFNWISRNSCYLCFFGVFFLHPGKHSLTIHVCLKVQLKGKLKIKVSQPSLGLKHTFTLGRTHTCSKPVLPSSSETQNSAAKARPTHSC